MNIFLHELRTYRKSTIIWSISLLAIIVMFFSLFPTFTKDVVDFKKILEGYPEVIKKAIGISIDSFTNLLSFYSFLFSYVLLCGAIQAMILGTSIISREARDKTADFLLTKPVTREKIITAKLMAVLTSLIITNIVYLTAAYFMAEIVKNEPYSLKIFFMISITLFFVQILFASIGVIFSVIAKKIKSVVSVSLGTVFTFFFISMFGSIIGNEVSKYLTPFKYFDTAYIIKNSSYETSFLIFGIILTISLITASYIIYSKKDIHSV